MPINLAGLAPVLGAIGGTVYGKLTQDDQDERQIKQQTKLQALQLKGAKEMAIQNRDLQMQMWEDTGIERQKEKIKEAGMNPALLYGMGGGGGQTAGGSGGGMPTGATAGDPNAGGMALLQSAMMGAQIKLAESQARKNNVEADKAAGIDTKEGEQRINESLTRQQMQKFQNTVNETIGADRIARNYESASDKLYYEQQKEMAEYNAWAAAGFAGKATGDENSPLAKAIRAGFEKSLVDLSNAKKDGNIKDAETAVKELEARLSQEGIPMGSPWYIKIIGDLLNKTGLINTK